MAALRAETDKVAHIESTIGMFTKCCQVYLIHLFNLKAIKVNQRKQFVGMLVYLLNFLKSSFLIKSGFFFHVVRTQGGRGVSPKGVQMRAWGRGLG